MKLLKNPLPDGSHMDVHRIYDLTVVHLFKRILSLALHDVIMLQAPRNHPALRGGAVETNDWFKPKPPVHEEALFKTKRDKRNCRARLGLLYYHGKSPTSRRARFATIAKCCSRSYALSLRVGFLGICLVVTGINRIPKTQLKG